MGPRTAFLLVAPALALLVAPAPASSPTSAGDRGSGVRRSTAIRAHAQARSPALRFRVPGDSLEIRLGAFRQWARLADIPARDTSWLGPGQDLVLRTSADSLLLPCSAGQTTVVLTGDARSVTETFIFASRAGHDLALHRAVLARYARFGHARRSPSVAFDDAADRDARELGRRFALDSIAGNGGQLARMRNLLHWIHTRVRWDGSRENPDAPTFAACVESCVTAGRTMNCGGLAAAYVDACRSVGLVARRIVCLPFDRADPDCHSVAIVYCDSLARWIYMDPTFEAWWTDARGELLDLARARAILARGEVVRVNPQANINGERRDPVEHLAYMSKNLFRFKTWPGHGRTLFLNPSGYANVAPDSIDVASDAAHAPILTDDPALFWAPPAARR